MPEPEQPPEPQQTAGPTIIDLGREIKAMPSVHGRFDHMSDEDVGREFRTRRPDKFGHFADVAVGPPRPTMTTQRYPSAIERFADSTWNAANPIPQLEYLRKVMMGDSSWAEAKQNLVDPYLDVVQKAGEAKSRVDESSMAPLANRVQGMQLGIPGPDGTIIPSYQPPARSTPAKAGPSTQKEKEDYFDWLAYSAAASYAPVAPQVAHAYEQAKVGNFAGAAGTVIGTAIPYFLGPAVRVGGRAVRNVAHGIYSDALDIPKGQLSLEERPRVVARGLGEAVAPDIPKSKAVAATLPNIQRVEGGIALDHAQVVQRQGAATASGISIDRNYILADIRQLADKLRNADPEMAKPLDNLIEFYETKKPTYLTPTETQELKQAYNGILSDSKFRDNANLSGRSAGHMALRDAQQRLLEQTADVQALNQANFLDIELAKRLRTALENHPYFMLRHLSTILGVATAGAQIAHAPWYATTAGLLATAAAIRQSPMLMTRVAIALNKTAPPVFGAAGVMADAFATLNPSINTADRRRQVNMEVEDIMSEILGTGAARQ